MWRYCLRPLYNYFNMQEEDAARAYDRVSIAMGKPYSYNSNLNFHHSIYSNDLEKLTKLHYLDVIACYLACYDQRGALKKKSSKYRGVSRSRKSKRRFYCSIHENGKHYWLGSYEKVSIIIDLYKICIM